MSGSGFTATSRTTLNALLPIAVYANTPVFVFCHTPNSALSPSTTLYRSSGTPTNIVAITPATVTILQNGSISDIASVGTSTSAGSYTITASATGFTSLVSDPVTVTQPFLTLTNSPYFVPNVGVGLHRDFTHHPERPATHRCLREHAGLRLLPYAELCPVSLHDALPI